MSLHLSAYGISSAHAPRCEGRYVVLSILARKRQWRGACPECDGGVGHRRSTEGSTGREARNGSTTRRNASGAEEKTTCPVSRIANSECGRSLWVARPPQRGAALSFLPHRIWVGASIGFDGLIVNNAAASSVGRLVAAYAHDHHIASVNVVRSAERAQQLSQETPAVPAVSTDTPGWPEKVREAAHGRPITAIMDPVGGQTASELFALLAPGGTLITYGQLSGDSATLDPAVLMSGSGQRGLTIGRWLSATSPEQRASDAATAVDLVLAQQQLLEPAAVYPLDELNAAVQRVSAPGKV